MCPENKKAEAVIICQQEIRAIKSLATCNVNENIFIVDKPPAKLEAFQTEIWEGA